MIGSFLTRGLVMIFGYAYPAYECYKTVEMNKPEIEQLRFWCQYWILVAVLTVCERIGDAFISWVPMYSEAKLAFYIYLWYPKTKGTTYVYDSFFRPYVAKHETEIDQNLLELRTRAGDIAVIYWQRAASYGQTRVYEILQYVAAQSTAKPHKTQKQPAVAKAKVSPDNVTSKSTGATTNQVLIDPSSSPSSSQQKDVAEEVGVSQVSKLKTTFEVPSSPKVSKPSKTTVEVPHTPKGLKPSTSVNVPNTPKAAAAASEPASSSSQSEPEPMLLIEQAPASVDENENPPPKETVIEEPTKVTRPRLRKTRSSAAANR
ncbi:HVA22-like protein i [Cucurbita moschata]|uniref:HVA22-like protein n=1 Tax=Cucurbita moschata TaxID=3662 RepID=A0A6J1FP87_CUCMO|nr:HVA22-like protein i [Cucurbita moschata]